MPECVLLAAVEITYAADGKDMPCQVADTVPVHVEFKPSCALHGRAWVKGTLHVRKLLHATNAKTDRLVV